MAQRRARTLLLVRALLYLLMVGLVVMLVERLAVVLAPVLTGLFLAYLFDPTVRRLEDRGVPRSVGIVLLLAVLAAVAALLVVLLPPLLSREVEVAIERWHATQGRLETVVLPWLRETLHLRKSAGWDEAMRQALARARASLAGASGDVSSAVGSAFSTAKGVMRIAIAVLLTPVFAIYFLSDYHALRDSMHDLVPPHLRSRVFGILLEINQALSSWLRGQLTVMLVLGVLYATGLALAGIPLGAAIGIITGLMAFVPYVGVMLGLCLALLAGLLDPRPASALFGVFMTFAAVQAVDGLFITPRILGGRVGISPVWVIFALTLGGELLGYAGVILAVPMAAVAKVLLGHARHIYLESRFYRGTFDIDAESLPPRPPRSEPPRPRHGGGP